ncbi:LLM class flavin-dependent oxidoreductase [Microbacterium testaceum]|uniref:LLM class flavin-dependent oxidoreductase n=1 Tax=Microbacterium testaceum TaxID=2033 RepID=UPI002FD7B2A9
MSGARLGFFTRLLDAGTDGERYRTALAQVRAAEQHGFASLWVAQHHFDRDEGGLPSPFPFLAAAAVQTERIALGTGIVTLPLDDPVRVSEDAAFVDALSDGRVQLGIGTGGTPGSFAAFDRSSEDRRRIQAAHVAVLRDAFAGRGIRDTNSRLNPAAPHLGGRLWQATFSVEGGRRAGADGDGLLLSRTQPREEVSRCTRCRCRSSRRTSPPCPRASRRGSSPRGRRWWWMPRISTPRGARPSPACGA